MRHRLLGILGGAAIGAAAVAPYAFEKGRGPAIRIVRVSADGPGRPGGFLPLRVTGHVRPGCVPVIARSITRYVRVNEMGVDDPSGTYRKEEKEPLANVPLVSHDPTLPASMAGLKPLPYKVILLPLPSGMSPSDPLVASPWEFNTEASPLFCDGIWGLVLSSFLPATVAAYDVPIQIVSATTATPQNPPAAAKQPIGKDPFK